MDPGDGVMQRAANDCGPAALVHCLRRFGTSVPYPDPGSTIRLGPRGCGFDQLVEEAARWGRRARHRRVSPGLVGDVESPAILYLRRGHFVVLEGTALRRDSSWDEGLYTELPEGDGEPVELRLIPYYTWLNRGEHEMRTWMPLA